MTKTTRGDVAGVVLAGGLSSRLGQEKALLRVHGREHPDLLCRTHNLLTALLPQCWVACRPGRPRPGYDCLYDQVEGLGPFSGVHAALRGAAQQGYAAVLALSCDLPFRGRATLHMLARARCRVPPTKSTLAICQTRLRFYWGAQAICR